MTTATPMLDAVDRAFLFHADQARRPLSPLIPPAIPLAERECLEIMPLSATGATVPSGAGQPETVIDDGQGTLVERLLRVAPAAWSGLARRVEDAHRRGAEVIAIAGGRRGEGRTTLVECLARTLAARGRRVERHECAPPELPPEDRDGGPIVLVDAGVWFPAGPLRRAWLERQSLGCHAVILVRRASDPACPARGTALEAIGLDVLGEVLTMVPPATSSVQLS